VLSVASEDSRDVEVLKNATLQNALALIVEICASIRCERSAREPFHGQAVQEPPAIIKQTANRADCRIANAEGGAPVQKMAIGHERQTLEPATRTTSCIVVETRRGAGVKLTYRSRRRDAYGHVGAGPWDHLHAQHGR